MKRIALAGCVAVALAASVLSLAPAPTDQPGAAGPRASVGRDAGASYLPKPVPDAALQTPADAPAPPPDMPAQAIPLEQLIADHQKAQAVAAASAGVSPFAGR
jgi:hypothetical protein